MKSYRIQSALSVSALGLAIARSCHVRTRSARFRRLAGLFCATAAGAISSLVSPTNAYATSELLVRIEHVVGSTASDGAVFTDFLIIDDQTLLEALRQEGSKEALINVQYAIEPGASIVSFSPPQKLEENVNYLPLDAGISFSRSGVFMGKVELEIQLGDSTLVDSQHFWIRHDGVTSSFISYLEYVEGRSRAAIPIKADPSANLEEGDIPGEGIKGPHECDPKRGTNRGARCGL
jgi:hypothetical protein